MSIPTVHERSCIIQESVAEEPRENDILQQESTSASGNLEKIRDILFGEQARAHERRFEQLEQHLLREAADLRQDLKRRFDTLEAYIKNEVDALTSRFAQEQDTRGQSVNRLGEELTVLTTALGTTARQLEQRTTEIQTQFQRQLAERVDALENEMLARQAQVTSAFDRTVHELRAEKTDRSALAALFMEASKQLSEDQAGLPRARPKS